MVTRKSFVVLLCAAALSGCYTEHFNYLENVHDRLGVYDCHIVTPYGSVENSGDSITVKSGGIVTMRQTFRTFTETECYVRVASGDAARLRFRTTDFGTSVAPGIDLLLGKSGSSVTVPGHPATPLAVRLSDQPMRVTCYSEAAVTTIVVGCDTVLSGKTALPATDVIAIESVEGSRVVVRGVSAANMRIKGEFHAVTPQEGPPVQ